MQENTYPAQLDRWFIQDALGPGPALLGGVGAFAVSQHAAGANMSVDVAAGRALIPGTDVTNQGSYSVWSDAVTNVPLAAAPGTGQSRIDVIVLQVRDDFVIGGGHSDFVIVPIQGTAAATGSQTIPTIPASSVALAQVLVGPLVTSIVTANITDVRPFGRGSMSIQTIPAPIAGAASTVTHNLNTTALTVSLWDSVTSQLVMAQVSTLNANQIQIAVAQNMPNAINVVIIGAVLSAAPVLASDLAPKAYVDARTPNLPGPITSGSGIQTFTDALGDVWVAANGVNAGAWRRARDVLSCYIYRNTALSVAALTNIAYDTIQRDPYGMWNVANANLITAPVTGLYHITSVVNITASASAQWVETRIVASATSVADVRSQSSVAVGLGVHASVVIYLTAGQTAIGQVATNTSLPIIPGIGETFCTCTYLGTG
jgi:hypothetical protein